MKKNLFKSFLIVITVALFFSSSSCEKSEEILTNKPESIYRLTDQDIIDASNLIKLKDDNIQAKKYGKTSKANFDEQEAPEQPYLQYMALIADQDLQVEIDYRTEHILDKTYEENIEYLKQLNLYSENELAAITAFKDELINTKNFKTSIFHFENAILLLPMTQKKLQRFYNLIDGLKVINAYDPEFFTKDSYTSKSTGFFGSCLSASIGLGAAFVGLATIQVGSFGVSTGVTVAGFIWASAEWGAACKDVGGNKRIYPADVNKATFRHSSDIFITLDENGDLVESPILVYYQPKPYIPFEP
ncbi:hypothetical protein [Flavobacterium luteolum]|uniref:hypothetical protein n=1 Tax=Flavobacterium luteolum TaxID=3003259 RepID=UPI00248EE8AB|nr:hypothetical protein [Flavobacterium luteolum]